jgi:hypothetical protein
LSRSTTALFVGLVLGLTAAFGTFGSFMIVLVFGAIGLIIGRALDGKLDVQSLIGRATEKR